MNNLTWEEGALLVHNLQDSSNGKANPFQSKLVFLAEWPKQFAGKMMSDNKSAPSVFHSKNLIEQNKGSSLRAQTWWYFWNFVIDKLIRRSGFYIKFNQLPSSISYIVIPK